MRIQVRHIRFKQGSAVPSGMNHWCANTLAGIDTLGMQEDSIPERPCCFRVISV